MLVDSLDCLLKNVAGRQAMRIDSIPFVLLLFAALAVTPAVSQDAAAPKPGNSHPVITAISVAEEGDGVAVEVTFSDLVRAKVSTLDHPDRLAFDFPGCELAHPGQRLVVNRGSVIAVRAAAFRVTPLVARVVIDLTSAQDHEETYAGNKLVIKLHPKLNSPGGTRRPAAANEGNNPASNSRAPIPKSDRGADRDADRGEADHRDVDQRSDRAAPKPSESGLPPPTPKTSTPPALGAQTAIIQPHAYALLDKARALTVSDLEPLEAKAQAGDPQSETTLALAYHAGTLLKMDDAEALRLLRHAANSGFVAAEEAMGIFCQLGFGMPPDKAQAVSWYTKAAQHGSRDAATNLALMYSTGDGVQKDRAKAATWFRSAAEAGDATAQTNLAALYRRGEGVPQDDTQSILWLTKAADQRFIPAMLELASWNLQPEHGASIDAAIGWYKKAADQGDASAQVSLGDIFTEERFGHVDYPQAIDWYTKAAGQGWPGGEFGLGALYLLGQGVPQNLEEARRHLTPAANQGHAYAQFLLATMFQAGQGGPVDNAAAAKYYELAANSGLPRAQYRLGLLLSSDRSNAASLVSAYKWLVLAEDSVKESAAPALELRKLLTPAQLAQAEHEIDEWRAAHLPRQPSH
jgi:TPR repeat protein